MLKKGYNAKFSTIEQLYKTAQMVEEGSHYNHRMQHVENTHNACCIQNSASDGPVKDHCRERKHFIVEVMCIPENDIQDIPIFLFMFLFFVS